MDTITVPQSQMTVDEVFSNWPSTYVVFSALKTSCIGCLLQRFCTLRDVAETYQIPFHELTGELEKHIQHSITSKGVSHE
jgi:hypothetical protein